jgi:DNA polymerase III delta prime subunit
VQDNISSFIERYPKTRIIWITNFLDAIRDRIISRAAGGVIGFVKPDVKDVARFLTRIAKEEHVKIKSADIMEIAKKSPSVRDAVGMLQQKAVMIKCKR